MVFNSSFATTLETDAAKNVTADVKPPYDTLGVIVASAAVFPMAVFGLLANLITVIVIYDAPNLRSIFNYYIMSLCISDLVSALLSPFWVYRRTWGFEEWKIPTFLCKLFYAGEFCTSIAISFHIAFFAGLRFVSIAKPHVFRRFTLSHAKISVLSIWSFCLIAGFIPYAVFVGVANIDRSLNKFNKNWPTCSGLPSWIQISSTYTTYANVFFFYTPLILVFVFSLATSVTILVRRSKRNKDRKKRPNIRNDNSTEKNRQAKENFAILQLLFIVGSFALGYIPNAVFLYSVFYIKNPFAAWWYGTGVYICLRFSECLNPIFYNLASSKLRAETVKWMHKVLGCKNEAGRIQERSKANVPSLNTISKKEVDESQI